jgi:hypothetical protein
MKERFMWEANGRPNRVGLVRCLCVAMMFGLILSTQIAARADPAPADQTASFSVDGPRALSQAVLTLIQQYGYAVTYEDAPLTYGGDLQDMTSQTHVELSYLKKPGAVREIAPVGETFTVQLPPPTSMADPKEVAALLDRILKEHATSARGGRFRVQKEDGAFHIVPTEVRDIHGKWISHKSLLDTKISIGKLTRSGVLMLDAICKAISAATQSQVVVGAIPWNAFAPVQGVWSAKDEPARKTLWRMLNSGERKFTWILDYDPARRRYYLSVILVPERPSGAPVGISPNSSGLMQRVVPGGFADTGNLLTQPDVGADA